MESAYERDGIIRGSLHVSKFAPSRKTSLDVCWTDRRLATHLRSEFREPRARVTHSTKVVTKNVSRFAPAAQLTLYFGDPKVVQGLPLAVIALKFACLAQRGEHIR